MDGYGPQTYGDRWADVYDDRYADVSDTEGTVERLADLAAGGRVLELGIGTGRIALPLLARGLEVVGLDASPEMLRLLRAKPGPPVAAVRGDMASLPFRAASFAVVFAAFNTLLNLPDAAAQRRCLGDAAAVLVPGGHLVVEAVITADDAPRSSVDATAVELDRVTLVATRRDPDAQTISGQHVDISADGIQLRPWFVRYVNPPELDDMAAAAGLELVQRRAGWRGEPYDPHGPTHVSTYRKPR